MQDIIKKADVLIEALPYIKAFHNKVTLIKYGGSILGDDKIRRGILEDIVFLKFMGLRPVLVHGGGPNISDKMRSIGKKTDFFDGMRVTDEETIKVVASELNKLNKKIVDEIKSLGANALTLKGEQNRLIMAKKKKAKINLGLVGEIVKVHAATIKEAMDKDYIPVITPMAMGADKKIYNINADEAAAFIAGSLAAEKFVLLTNVTGIMRDISDPASLISTLNIQEAKKLMEHRVVQEGMIPKVKACIHALEGGVKKTHIIDARAPHAILLEIFTDRGIGTEIMR